jgi:hypothetical protein
MNMTNQVEMLISMFAAQLPTLLICLVAGVVIFLRWKEAPGAAVWALLGFGLATILCVAIPVVQAGVQQWLIHSGHTPAERTSIFAGLGFVWSGLRAVTYAFLLAAVFAGRSRPT